MTHLKFEVIEQKPKTKVYSVISAHDKSRLGKIYWYGRWRGYIFEPYPDTIWSEDCLEEVYKFLKSLRIERILNLMP